jgi:protein-tyrosine phosphatase
MNRCKTVLFLCSGNYYRSRFAEMLFNARMEQLGIGWRAESRGLGVGRAVYGNVGPISPYTLEGLRQRGISWPDPPREPLPPCEDDFALCPIVIALKEAEHRPLMSQCFPQWEAKIEYWHVHDVDQAAPSEALPEIERLVDGLVERLIEQERASHPT